MSRRALLSALAVGAVSGSVLTAPSAFAQAAFANPADALSGHISSVRQNAVTHTLLVRGYAWDALHPGAPIRLSIVVDGKFRRGITTRLVRKDVNRRFDVTGTHGFVARVTYPRTAKTVQIRAHGAKSREVRRVVDGAVPSQVNPGQLIVAWAKKYVGITPYVYGGASPSGFDCSGFAMYVYKKAGVKGLPHSAQAQRTMRGMKHISRKKARPGDLVFYQAGGYTYHVSVYAGHGREYAATQPGERIKYQRIWHSNVIFGTTWH